MNEHSPIISEFDSPEEEAAYLVWLKAKVAASLADPRQGRYAAAIRFDQPGVYTMMADVRRGSQPLGTAKRSALVGGVDVEMAEPRLNDAVLRRISETTHGVYVPAAEADSLPPQIEERDAASPPMEMHDLWHNGFSLAAIVALLAAEWLVRRRVGLA